MSLLQKQTKDCLRCELLRVDVAMLSLSLVPIASCKLHAAISQWECLERIIAALKHVCGSRVSIRTCGNVKMARLGILRLLVQHQILPRFDIRLQTCLTCSTSNFQVFAVIQKGIQPHASTTVARFETKMDRGNARFVPRFWRSPGG